MVTQTDTNDKEIDELKLLKDEHLLDRVADEVGKRVEGERDAIKTIFTVLNMRNVANLEKATDNLMVNDEGGTGKDHVVSSVFRILPEREKDMRVRITPKVLAYLNDTKVNPEGWVKKCLYLEDVPNNVLNDDAFKVMSSSDPNGTTQTSIVINNVLRNIDIRGKPSIVITIAMASPKQELLRRYPIINLTSTTDQTKAVLKKHASFAMNGKASTEYEPLFAKALSRLKRVEVVVPFADRVAGVFPVGNVIIRTHFPRFLDYIKSSASLHQYQRERDENGKVVATEQDYEVARSIMALTTSNQLMIPLTKLQKNIMERFKKLQAGTLEEKRYSFEELFDAMQKLGGESWLRKNIKKLVEYGFISQHSERIDKSNKPVAMYKVMDVDKLELPSFKELGSCPDKTPCPDSPNKPNSPNKLNPSDSNDTEYLDNLDYSDNNSSEHKLLKQLFPSREEKLVRAAAKLLKDYGGLTTDQIVRWNPRLTEEHLRKAKEQGLIYEPRAGYWKVLE